MLLKGLLIAAVLLIALIVTVWVTDIFGLGMEYARNKTAQSLGVEPVTGVSSRVSGYAGLVATITVAGVLGVVLVYALFQRVR